MKKVVIIAMMVAIATAAEAKIHPHAGTSFCPALKNERFFKNPAEIQIQVFLKEISQKISFSNSEWMGFETNFLEFQSVYEDLRWGTGTIGFSFFSRQTDLENYDERGIRSADNIEAGDTIFIISAGGRKKIPSTLIQNLFWGLNIKHVQSEIDDSKRKGIGVDVGIFLVPNFSEKKVMLKNVTFDLEKWKNLGLCVQNIGPKIKGDSLPLIFTAEGSYELNKNAVLNIGVRKPRDNWTSFFLKGEYKFENFCFQVGYSPEESKRDFEFGFAARYNPIELAYTYTPNQLDSSHMITLSHMRFK